MSCLKGWLKGNTSLQKQSHQPMQHTSQSRAVCDEATVPVQPLADAKQMQNGRDFSLPILLLIFCIILLSSNLLQRSLGWNTFFTHVLQRTFVCLKSGLVWKCVNLLWETFCSHVPENSINSYTIDAANKSYIFDYEYVFICPSSVWTFGLSDWAVDVLCISLPTR